MTIDQIATMLVAKKQALILLNNAKLNALCAADWEINGKDRPEAKDIPAKIEAFKKAAKEYDARGVSLLKEAGINITNPVTFEYIMEKARAKVLADKSKH
ncbi:MAG: hypothetical protein RR490_01615 [Niameybacter sp.]